MNPLKNRPYWHVDFKWIFGILAFVTLGTTLLVYNLSNLTERDRATTMSATVVASLFSKEGLDDESGLAELKQKAAQLPGDTVSPIEQFPWLTISKQDLETKTPRELRISIFRQITDPIYDKGLDGAAATITPNPGEQEQFKKDATLLGIFTKKTHDVLQKVFIGLACLSVVLICVVIFFSDGWGKLVSPGVLLLLVSPIGAIASLLFLRPPTDGDALLASLPSSVTAEIGTSLSSSYLAAALLGIVLLIVAGIGKAVQRSRRPKVTL